MSALCLHVHTSRLHSTNAIFASLSLSHMSCAAATCECDEQDGPDTTGSPPLDRKVRFYPCTDVNMHVQAFHLPSTSLPPSLPPFLSPTLTLPLVPLTTLHVDSYMNADTGVLLDELNKTADGKRRRLNLRLAELVLERASCVSVSVRACVHVCLPACVCLSALSQLLLHALPVAFLCSPYVPNYSRA